MLGEVGIHLQANKVPLHVQFNLAMLFGDAVRTGPPVPGYFAIGPLLIAPIPGISIFANAPVMLWILAGLTGLLCVAAWVRHRVAVARGTEEPELSADEAADADQKRMVKLREKLKR